MTVRSGLTSSNFLLDSCNGGRFRFATAVEKKLIFDKVNVTGKLNKFHHEVQILR